MSSAPPVDFRAEIESFLKQCRQPALLEPGEELLALAAGNFTLEFRGSRLTLDAWDRTRNISRRIMGVRRASAARLIMTVERFGKRQGEMFLLDLARPAGEELGRRSSRLVFRERFRLFLRRQFPDWRLAELSAEPNLEHSLSPAFPRAFLRSGQHGWAAIACPPSGDSSAILSFGLIWLSYLRQRERRVTLEGLALYLPTGEEQTSVLRLLCLNPSAARFELFVYSDDDTIVRVDPRDHGNLDTRLEPCRRPPQDDGQAWLRILKLPGVERIPKHNGRYSLRVRGLEFAELSGTELLIGDEGRPAREHDGAAVERIVEEMYRVRAAETDARDHPLYRRNPEAWLESEVRGHLAVIDPTLLPDMVYAHVPAFTGREHGIPDLLAADRRGCLAVLELKASPDLHLPLQALDYWIRVKWHLDRGEFTDYGYFPGLALTPDPPRILLVAPSLDFHPTTEPILSYFSPGIDVERIGLGVEWRRGLQVMFRLKGAERPQ
jgi:hypothetical protein